MVMALESYSISDLAGEFAITPRTLRFYEDKDLIHPTRKGQTRIFSRRDRVRLKLILRGRRLGFSLADIKEMLDLYDLGDGQVEQLSVTLHKGRRRLAELRQQRHEIEAAIGELEESCAAIEQALNDKGAAVDAL